MAALLTALGFVFGWNNSGLTAGNLANFVNYNLALLLTVTGIVTGAMLLGSTMSSSVLGKLVSANLSGVGLLSGILVSLITLLALTVLRLPVSLSNCVVGAFVGSALATNAQVQTGFLFVVVISWIAAPLTCALVSRGVYFVVTRSERSRSLLSIEEINRLLLLVMVFLVSLALGTNNIGLILSFAKSVSLSPLTFGVIEAMVLVAATLGTVLFGRILSGVISERVVGLSQIKTLSAMVASTIVTTMLTSLSIPVSLTQVIIGGMLGAGISQRPSIANRHELTILVSGWTLVTVASAGLGFVVSLFFISIKLTI